MSTVLSILFFSFLDFLLYKTLQDYSDAHCQRLLDDIKNLNYAQIYNDLSSEFHIKRPEKNDVCLWYVFFTTKGFSLSVLLVTDER